jgi:hypothetical protein
MGSLHKDERSWSSIVENGGGGKKLKANLSSPVRVSGDKDC